jgi:hypothetical protein
VLFGNGSKLLVKVGPFASDRLAITGGVIDLTSANDQLFLRAWEPYAFAGSTYTIATFDANRGGGVFNNVSGLPANYKVVYLPDRIELRQVPEPCSVCLALTGSALLGVAARRRPKG